MRRIYLDNAATSFPKAPGLGERVRRYLDEEVVNLYRTDSPLEEKAFAAVDGLRSMIAGLYGSPWPEAISFTQNATQALNAVIKGLVREGDEVIVSSNEHNSAMRPLSQIGAHAVRIPSHGDGYNDYGNLPALFSSRTKAVIINAASNVSGAVQDLAPAAEEARRHGIPLIIDAAQATPFFPIDLMGIDAAAICFTGHKGLLGPQGTGGMVLRRSIAESIEPLVTGGTGSESDSEEVPSYLPDRLSGGTENLTGLVGLEHALRYVTENLGTLRDRERHALERLYEGLMRIDGIAVRGPSPDKPRTAVVSLSCSRMDIAGIAGRLSSEYGIETRVGLHCSPSAHRSLGTFPTGTLRLSPGPFTTDDEIDRTLSALEEILR